MPADTTTQDSLLLAVAEQILKPDAGEFVGRAFTRDIIKQFQAVHNRMLVFVGPPGIGKTALAAALVRERAEAGLPYLAHFCELSGDDNPYRFCTALAEQLHAQLGENYKLPQTARNQQVIVQASVNVGQATGEAHITALELNIGGMHPREAFRQLVREPLNAYDKEHRAEHADKPLIVVIDALDRAWEWDSGQGGNIVSILADVQDLPPWINLICTARPGPAMQALRAQAGVRVFDIDPFSRENLDDIGAFFRERFLGALEPGARERFNAALAQSDAGTPHNGSDPATIFVERAVRASQGNFLFVRRYVDALRAALQPGAGQPVETLDALLRFGAGETLTDALDATYATIYAQVRPALDAHQGDADELVLAALAIAFAPLNMALLKRLTGRETEDIAGTLDRLAPVLAQAETGAGARAYSFYHSGFAEYVRRQLPKEGRDWDVRAAHALEQDDGGDALVRDYAARFRWSHLLRGLDLAAAARAGRQPAAGDTTGVAQSTPDGAPLNSIAQVQAQVQDALTQAQLLRGLAARALDPAQMDAAGSWNAALECLKAAERALRRSRALVFTTQRGWRVTNAGAPTPESVELERTLIALGDAHATIARRMDAGGRRPGRPIGVLGWLHAIWNAIARLPLTLYLTLILWWQGVRTFHIPGALQNLGRAQDWTVARLCVLSLSAYRRAYTMAHARAADDVADDIVERLGRLYVMMGAYDAAATTYEMLLARPTTMTRGWLQAVWRLAFGEVLVAQGRTDQAVELLTSALPIFIDQQAPVQRARALSALALAHHDQALAAEARGDRRLSAQLDDLSLADCGAALTAWADVSTLQGDETISVDPALAVSRLAHYLWMTSHNPRMGDEQQRAARALLDTIPARHFPQRFEHPLLHLFRMAAAIFLPAYVLAGLLLAVQLPSDVQVRTRPDLAFQPPLLDLARFPNNLIEARSVSPANLSIDNLTQLAAGGDRLRFLPSAPALDPLAITWVVVLFIGLYLLCYTLIGLAVISFSSPAQFQNRRPGRLVLEKDRLRWHGPVGQGSVLDALDWIARDILALRGWMRQQINHILGLRLPQINEPQMAASSTLELANVEGLIVMDRRVLGHLLHDFSFTLVQQRTGERRPLFIPGTLVNYEELGDELERRSKAPRRQFGVDFVRSPGGICFMLALLYALLLVIFLPLAPATLTMPLPWLDYSLSNLYILAAPGLLLPLLWWFVAQPLGASITRSWVALPLLATTTVGIVLTMAALGGQASLAAFGLKPDLATPILATGVLAALACYAPPRPLFRVQTAVWRHLVRIALALLSLGGLALLAWHIGTTLLWYNALVRGNKLVEQALLAPKCVQGSGDCAAPDQAIYYYDQMICLRPDDSDGYAFRGFAYLSRNEYTRARIDFERALGGQPNGELTPGCPSAESITPKTSQQASLYANLGAVDALLARQVPPEEAEQHYTSALLNYARALDLPDEIVSSSGGTADAPGCYAIALYILRPGAPVSTASGPPDITLGLDPLAPGDGRLAAARAPVVSQLADACYSRGFARLRLLPSMARADRETARFATWRDLAAAAAEYNAVIAVAKNPQDRLLARRGLAATWLALSQIDPPPAGTADRRSYLLYALTAFQDLEQAGQRDVSVLSGQAWTAIQLGAWDTANAPLAGARAQVPDDPTFPALQGLVAWLDSTQYPIPRKGAPSPGYAGALRRAVDYYTEVIALGPEGRDRAYATRSLLFFSLRNSPYSSDTLAYTDEDYGAWMRRAIGDIDQALIAAGQAGLTHEQQVGYRYWRGRLSFALALTWQEKFRGPHEWSELVPLYGQAYEDFTSAAAIDPNPDRKAVYLDQWIPWSRVILTNATHMQLAQMHARRGRFEQARAELKLVDPRPAAVRQWNEDVLSAPRPDYSYLHGLISLGLGLPDPQEFPNRLLESRRGTPTYAEASYTLAITETEDTDIVAQPSAIYPDDSRPQIYRAALADLDVLLEFKLTPEARAAAERVRNRLQKQLDAALLQK